MADAFEDDDAQQAMYSGEHSDAGTLSDSGHSETSMRLRREAAEAAGPSTKRSRQEDFLETEEHVSDVFADDNDDFGDFVDVEEEPDSKRSKTAELETIEEEEPDLKKTKGGRKGWKGKGKAKA